MKKGVVDRFSYALFCVLNFDLEEIHKSKSMEAFANMTDAEKQAAVEKSRQMHSRVDMERYVDGLGESIDRMV